jgi:hypothetical protein
MSEELRRAVDDLNLRDSASATPVRLKAGSSLEALENLSENIRELEERSGLAPLPVARPDDEFNRLLALRLLAVRTRLRLLGYGVTDLTTESVDAPLRTAILSFQAEAGIEQDGWVGPETWGRLQELVAFESTTVVANWFDADSNARPALVRAMMVRLGVLGLCDYPPNPDPNGNVLIAVNNFRTQITLLKFPLRDSRYALTPELTALLFGHEELIRHLAQEPGIEKLLDIPADADERTLPGVKRFVYRLVQTELWLDGLNTAPAAPNAPPRDLASRPSVQTALEGFWTHVEPPLSTEELHARSARINQSLFKTFAARLAQPVVQAEVVAQYVEQNKGVLERAWEQVKRGVFFLWDGVKRSLRWLWDRIRGAAQKVTDATRAAVEQAKAFMWHILRVIYDQASEVLQTVRHATVAFVDGIRTYFDGEFVEGAGERAVMVKSMRDFDALVWATRDVTAAEAHGLKQRFRRVAAALSAACRVLALVADILFTAASAGWGVVLLLSALVRRGPQILNAFKELADAGEEQLLLA